VVAVGALGACARSREAGVLVHVEGSAPGAIAALHVVGTSAVGRVQQLDVLPPAGSAEISLPVSFALVLQTDRRGAREGALAGPFMVCVTARDAADGDLASACASTTLVPGEEAEVTVTLGPSSLDAGADAGSDATTDAGTDASLDGGASCGDGIRESTEACDGSDLGTDDCTTIGMGFIGGTLACTISCTYDTAACTPPPLCVNGVLDAGEDCDGALLGGSTCMSLGWGAGTLGCTGGCVFDQSGCFSCGDGVVGAPETCDGANVGTETCVSLGHDGGTLGCAADCFSFDDAACTDCGDDLAAGAEVCDGVDLAGQDCTTAGAFSGGSLACSATCDAFDTSACNGPPTVPVLRRPMNGAYVGSIGAAGSRRPVFAWEASTVAGGAPVSYELEYTTDPSFATGVTAVPTVATSEQPAADLPVALVAPVGARFYWRVRACAGSACSGYAPAWWVNVGRSDRDFDGDGFADALAGAEGADAAYLYRGGAGALDATADVVFAGAAASAFGRAVAYAGDLNADGFADVVAGAPLAAPGALFQAGQASVYFGSAAGDAVADGVIDGTLGALLGSVVGPAGDVDADGYADLYVSAPGLESAFLFRGGPGAALDTTADATLAGTPGSSFGVDVGVAAGDLNGDGFGDLAAGGPGDDTAGTDAGRVDVWLGGPGAFDPVADDAFFGGAPGDAFGSWVDGAGDVNGDGFAELIVGAASDDGAGADAGRAYVYFGGPGGPDAAADGTLDGEAAGDQLGARVAGLGDVNGDGFADVGAGAPASDAGGASAGRAYVFFGAGGAALDAVADGVLTGAAAGDSFAMIGAAGDLDGDGVDDVIVGAAFHDAGPLLNAGEALVFFGAPGAALDTTADGTLLGLGAGFLFGGSVD
jgi:hypothetical protein